MAAWSKLSNSSVRNSHYHRFWPCPPPFPDAPSLTKANHDWTNSISQSRLAPTFCVILGSASSINVSHCRLPRSSLIFSPATLSSRARRGFPCGLSFLSDERKASWSWLHAISSSMRSWKKFFSVSLMVTILFLSFYTLFLLYFWSISIAVCKEEAVSSASLFQLPSWASNQAFRTGRLRSGYKQVELRGR